MSNEPIFHDLIRKDAKGLKAFDKAWWKLDEHTLIRLRFIMEAATKSEDAYPPLEMLDNNIKTYCVPAEGYDVELIFALEKKTKSIFALEIIPMIQTSKHKELAYKAACEAFGLKDPKRECVVTWFS